MYLVKPMYNAISNKPVSHWGKVSVEGHSVYLSSDRWEAFDRKAKFFNTEEEAEVYAKSLVGTITFPGDDIRKVAEVYSLTNEFDPNDPDDVKNVEDFIDEPLFEEVDTIKINLEDEEPEEDDE